MSMLSSRRRIKYDTGALSHAKLGISGSKLLCLLPHCATFRRVALKSVGEALKQLCELRTSSMRFEVRFIVTPLAAECSRIQRYRHFFPLAFVLCRPVKTRSPCLALPPAPILSSPLLKLVLVIFFPFPPRLCIIRLSDTSLLIAMQPFSLFTERYAWFGALILTLASPPRHTFTYTASGISTFDSMISRSVS